MTTEWSEPEEEIEEPDADDPGFVGGGGPASTMDDVPGDEEELDEHGDNLSRADEEDL